jgi:hypothetical protein
VTSSATDFSVDALEARAVGVRIADDRLIVDLVDGRVLGVPLGWFPRLANATPEQRSDWYFINDGESIRWEAVDEDISVPLLLGLPCP